MQSLPVLVEGWACQEVRCGPMHALNSKVLGSNAFGGVGWRIARTGAQETLKVAERRLWEPPKHCCREEEAAQTAQDGWG